MGGNDATSAADASNDSALPRNAIVFAAALDGQAEPDLYVIVAQKTITRLTTSAGAELYPTISPDRRSIAFVRDFQLFVIDADGGNERLVAEKTGRERKINDQVYSTTLGPAAWSPDGTQLAYLYPRDPFIEIDGQDMIDESGATTIHIINADGTRDHAVPNLGGSLGPTINSLDWGRGETLTFMVTCDAPDCAGGMNCATIQTDGTGYQDIVFLIEGQPSWPRKQIDWSPDNSLWAFVNYASIPGNSGAYEQPGNIGRSTPFVDDLHELGVIGWGPRWSTDGNGIAYIAQDGIYVIGAFEGGPRLVLAVPGVRGIDF